MIELNKIYHKDCIDFMKELIENKIEVDLVICDPPYNISQPNNFNTMGRQSIDFGKWDKDFDQLKWLELLPKIVAKNGSVIIFNGWRNLGLIDAKLEELGFVTKNILRWIKTNPMPRNIERSYVSDFEFILFATKKNSKWVFNKGMVKYLRPEYHFCAPKGKDRIHPTQKSLELIKELIKVHSNPKDLILDCFSGSGSVSISAFLEKRNFLSCEIDKEYYEKSLIRLEKYINKEK